MVDGRPWVIKRVRRTSAIRNRSTILVLGAAQFVGLWFARALPGQALAKQEGGGEGVPASARPAAGAAVG